MTDPIAPQRPQTLLGLLERFLQTDIRYLISGSFWLGVSQIGIGLIAFGVSIAFAHFVSKEAYGTYRFLLSLFWTIAAFSFSGITGAMARAVARGQEGAYRASFVPFIIGCLPMTLIGVGMSVYYYFAGNMLLAGGMLVIAVFGALFQPSYLFGSFLEGKRAFKMNAAFGIAVNGIPALCLLVAMLHTQNPLILFAIYLGMNVLVGAALCVFAYVFYKPNQVNDPDLINLSFHLSANGVLSSIAQQADDLLVFHALGAASLAIYTFATAMPDQVKNLANTVSTVAFPKFAARPIEEIMPTLFYRMMLFTVALAAATAAYWLAAPFLFHILFPSYDSSIWYSQLYALTIIPVSSIIPLTILQAQAAKRELYIANIVGPIAQIGMLVVLIGIYGLLGAVIARILGRLFNLALLSALVKYRPAPPAGA